MRERISYKSTTEGLLVASGPPLPAPGSSISPSGSASLPAGASSSTSSTFGTVNGIGFTGGLAASPSAFTCSTYFGGSKFFLICSSSSFSRRPHSGGGRAVP